MSNIGLMESRVPLPLPQMKQSESSLAMDSCRVCMSPRLHTGLAFEEIFDNSVCDKLQFCTGLQAKKSDCLPTHICAACLKDLDSAYKFKTTCLESDQTYRKLLHTQVKKEINEYGSESEMPVQDTFEELQSIKVEDSKVSLQDEIVGAVLGQTDFMKRTVRRKAQKIDESPTQDVKVPPARTRKKRAKPPGESQGSGQTPGSKSARLYCEACQIQFSSKDQYFEHKKLIHKVEGKSWICETCGKMFVHQSSHISHARCHLPPTFACAQCEYVTWHKHDLKKHLQRHTGFKPYQCEFCTAAYFCSSNLKSHIERVHHQVKRFKCPVCDKEFFERHKLARHLDSHNDIKRFSCQVCSSQFTRGSYLRQHMVKQHGVDPPRVRPGRRRTVFAMGQTPWTPENTS